MLDALPETPPQPHTAPSGPRRVALLGKPNVGKSSLLNKLAGEQRVLVDDVAGTTRDPVDELIELGGKTWRFVDTAGIRRRFRESQGADYYAALRTAGALEVAEVAVVLVDASEPLTEQDLRIISMVIEAGRALVIAFNKWDLVDEERQHYLEREIDRQLYNARWAPRVNISATTGRHVDRLVPAIETALAGWETRISTGRLNAWLNGLIAATPPPVRGGRQPKVLFATQAGIRPPHVVLFTTRFLEASYRRFVERKLREEFGFDGSPLKVSMRHTGEARPQRRLPGLQRQPPLIAGWTFPAWPRPIAAGSGTPTPRCPAPTRRWRSIRVRGPAPPGRARRLPGQAGAELVDGMSSWWAAIHGYRHPALDRAASAQLGQMSHVMFGGLTHEPAVRLCDRLATLEPRRPGARVPVRLRVGLGRGRRQDVPAVLALPRPPGQTAAADLARRLPRGHVLGHVGV